MPTDQGFQSFPPRFIYPKLLNRLQLVFTYQVRRHYISTGYADTPRNRKAAMLEDDIETRLGRLFKPLIFSGHQKMLANGLLATAAMVTKSSSFLYKVFFPRIAPLRIPPIA